MDERAIVLDVGGWAEPFERADWVIDLMPYETRGLYGRVPEPQRERFDAGSWVQRDVCDRDPWPFSDDQFDFVVCSHTLEDVRDPVWVCSEIIRVGRAGYVEVPSRLEEQTYGIQGPWVGWSHHRWLVEVGDGEIAFVFKPHFLHGRPGDHFPAGFADRLTPEERVQTLWWEGSFAARERVFVESQEVDGYIADFVAVHGAGPLPADQGGRLRRRLRRRWPRAAGETRRPSGGGPGGA